MSSALKIAQRYKDINSIRLHFERTHISVVVKVGCNLKTRARNIHVYMTDRICHLFVCVEVLRPSQPNGVM